jgi:molybdopterin converting factor small subunit
MTIIVTLHATLRTYLPAGSQDNVVPLQMPEGATAADVISHLAIPPAHTRVIVSGAEHLEPTTVLHDGQEVNLFPPLAGG